MRPSCGTAQSTRSAVPRSECCFERPPRERIDEILKNRKHDIAHRYLRYEARRDYLQLCCEVDYLRADFKQHTDAVGKFLDEIYSIMVDPLEDGIRPVVVTMERIRQAALQSREDGNNVPDLLAACKALQMEAAARNCGLRIADEAIAKIEARANGTAL